jgi:hypothetical protein
LQSLCISASAWRHGVSSTLQIANAAVDSYCFDISDVTNNIETHTLPAFMASSLPMNIVTQNKFSWHK